MTTELLIGLIKIVVGAMCFFSFLLGYAVCAYRYEKKVEDRLK